MDGIEYWLKNTIWGLIILGGLGSILAILIISIIKKLFNSVYKYLPKFVQSIIQKYKRYRYDLGYKYGKETGRFIFSDNLGPLVFFSFHILFTLFYSLLCCTTIIILFVKFSFNSFLELNIISYLMVVLAYLFLYKTISHLRFISSCYKNYDKIVDIKKNTKS